MNFTKLAIAAASAIAFATPTLAATLLSVVGPTGPVASPGAFTYTFSAAASAGNAAFDINGYASLDGVNCCTDVFTLTLNGTDVFKGSFALGGGGTNTLYFGPVGATYTAAQFAFFGGGVANLFVPLNFAAGTNTLVFSYSGDAQGLGDEAWGLSNVVVSGGAVPEPASWAMLIAGFGMVGYASRRRRTAITA